MSELRRARQSLEARLGAHGIEDSADPFTAWCRLRDVEDRKATVIDLYALVARRRDLQPHDLPRAERVELARRALKIIWPETTEGSDRGAEPVELVAYDSGWPTRFAAWHDQIAAALGNTAVRIEHVGSMAVPGLEAKPTIDIQVSVINLDDEDAYVPKIESAGLQLRSRDIEHRYPTGQMSPMAHDGLAPVSRS
jgi:GrpB protein